MFVRLIWFLHILDLLFLSVVFIFLFSGTCLVQFVFVLAPFKQTHEATKISILIFFFQRVAIVDNFFFSDSIFSNYI